MTSAAAHRWLNLLEPPTLVDAFLRHPPAGFVAASVESGAAAVPAFVTRFDLLTTLDDPYRRMLTAVPLLGRALRPRTLFVGTTVSEYCLYPPLAMPQALIAAATQRLDAERAAALIIKDIPQDSPLLSGADNAAALALVEACRDSGWSVVAGQALAYVPLDFARTEDLLLRMSRVRRKSIRRKLRAAAGLEIGSHATGDPLFEDAEVVSAFYALYLNVYRQSAIHFDRLSETFFAALLRGREHNGLVFTYRYRGRLIGYNLCFVKDGNLVDKYVGFEYPAAREHNLYYVSWFHNLEYALRHGLRNYVAGWTDPEVKSFLGARFTLTRHAVHLRNPVLRATLRRFQRYFEPDRRWGAQPAERAPTSPARGGAQP
jgi:predicted N-acyltransferase